MADNSPARDSARLAFQQTKNSDGLHQLNAVGNRPLDVKINTLNVDPARLIALEIDRRHKLRGTLNNFPKTRRAAASLPAIYFALLRLGKQEDFCGGLIVHESPDQIGDEVGLCRSIAYVALRILAEAKVVRRIGRGGRTLEVLMPDGPSLFDGRSGREASKNNDLESTTPDGARAPVEIARALPDFSSTQTGGSVDAVRAQVDEKSGSARAPSTCARTGRSLSTDSNVNVNALLSADAEEEENEKIKILLEQNTNQPTRHQFDVGAAIALAHHPNATLRQIRFMIERCDFIQGRGRLKKSRAAFITRGIFENWQPPPTPQEKELASKERAIRAEQRIGRDTPTQMPLEIMRRKILALPPEKVKDLIERVIAAEPDDSFFRAHFLANKDSALKRQVFTQRIFELAIEDRLILDEQQIMHEVAVGEGGV